MRCMEACIIYDERTSFEALICSLWYVRQPIPQELTCGEPYDSCFSSWKPYDKFLQRRQSNLKLLYYLFEHADQLPVFLVYALHVTTPQLTPKGYLETIYHIIWQQIPALSQGEPFSDITRLLWKIRHTSLSKLDLVYLAVLLEQHHVFKTEFSLSDFVHVTSI